MYGLSPHLSGQAVEALRVNLRAAIELRDELKALTPRKDKPTKKGYAPIQVTICWAQQHVRLNHPALPA
jgi:hypothetical protein